jgi:hypothetical protein
MKIIRFFSKKEYENLGQPTLAKKFIPQWYKDSELTFVGEDGKEHAGLKRCVPFLDAMISGYMLTTPVDIFVSKNEDNSLNITWNSLEELQDFVSERTKDLGKNMPRPAGHYPNHLAFRGFWGFKTPKGWSVLVVHPLNRHDLPFTTISAIIDGGFTMNPTGSVPFYIKKDFEGIIPQGTPIMQIIPFYQQNWISKNTKGVLKIGKQHSDNALALISGWYKKTFWSRKKYE